MYRLEVHKCFDVVHVNVINTCSVFRVDTTPTGINTAIDTWIQRRFNS